MLICAARSSPDIVSTPDHSGSDPRVTVQEQAQCALPMGARYDFIAGNAQAVEMPWTQPSGTHSVLALDSNSSSASPTGLNHSLSSAEYDIRKKELLSSVVEDHLLNVLSELDQGTVIHHQDKAWQRPSVLISRAFAHQASLEASQKAQLKAFALGSTWAISTSNPSSSSSSSRSSIQSNNGKFRAH